MRGTHPLVYLLNEAQREHYRAFMGVVREHDIHDVIRAVDRMTGMRWRGSSRSDLAYYYATAKQPHRHHGGQATFPLAAKCNLKKLLKELDK